jgi:hypothetical protein
MGVGQNNINQERNPEKQQQPGAPNQTHRKPLQEREYHQPNPQTKIKAHTAGTDAQALAKQLKAPLWKLMADGREKPIHNRAQQRFNLLKQGSRRHQYQPTSYGRQ